MSEQSKSKSSPKSSPKSSVSKSTEAPAKSDTAKTSDSTSATPSKSEGGKSSRESIGGAGAVHYGFFSNVKTPQYRSGWDDIWNEETKPKKKKPARAKGPVAISLAFDELPEEVQRGLAEVARAKLKKSRTNYDDRARAGAVGWRIDCEVKR